MIRPQLLSAWAGHWTGDGTGVTVILPPPGTVGSGEVRGGAPATREFALLEPGRLVEQVDAVVLSGGSAFGLAAGDGVATLLRERGRGFPTPFGPVPIVVGMSIFDASVAADPPGPGAGRAAALAALTGQPFLSGTAGAATGATTGKWRGALEPGGLGRATGRAGPATIEAVAVVNAWGDVLDSRGNVINARGNVIDARGHVIDARGLVIDAGGDVLDARGHLIDGRGVVTDGDHVGPGPRRPEVPFGRPMTNTTIAVLLTDAKLSKTDCHLLAQSGHTGFARALHPAHSRYDGDAVVALATGEVDGADLDLLRAAATEVMAAAIRDAVVRPA
ncbi:P1 family peptidase [Actinoplanes subglobosus]|uniref:P1 family peptidase n=1 Tax=Actinoplanes subglobosus TaxID=1547892 RepID=A0ABV8J397_9ACTN